MEDDRTIGAARMLEDGTITLQLMAEGEDGMIGDAYFKYKPDDPEYEDIKRHIGEIRPGEEKMVRPWPNE